MANVLRSVLVLALLFGLVFAMGMAINVALGLPTSTAIVYAVPVVLLQYLLGPLILEWLFDIEWLDPDDLSPQLAAFARRVCAEHGIPALASHLPHARPMTWDEFEACARLHPAMRLG